MLYSTRLYSTSISYIAMLIAASKLYSTRASYIAWPKVPDGGEYAAAAVSHGLAVQRPGSRRRWCLSRVTVSCGHLPKSDCSVRVATWFVTRRLVSANKGPLQFHVQFRAILKYIDTCWEFRTTYAILTYVEHLQWLNIAQNWKLYWPIF